MSVELEARRGQIGKTLHKFLNRNRKYNRGYEKIFSSGRVKKVARNARAQPRGREGGGGGQGGVTRNTVRVIKNHSPDRVRSAILKGMNVTRLDNLRAT